MSVFANKNEPILQINPQTLKFTISEIKFNASTHSYDHRSNKSNNLISAHSSSLQYFHGGVSYRSEKQKRTRRLKSKAFELEDNQLQSPHLQIFRTWNHPFAYPQRQPQTERMINHEYQTIKSQKSQQLTLKKLPTLKNEISVRIRKHQSAKRDIKPTPDELVTRKIHWQHNSNKPSEHTEPKPKPKTSLPPKMTIKLRQKQKHPFIRLTGWQLQLQQEYPSHQLHL